MKASKAFIKPFEAPQRSVKIKTQLNSYFSTTFSSSGVRTQNESHLKMMNNAFHFILKAFFFRKIFKYLS